MDDVGRYIRDRRRAADMTQSGLGALIGARQSEIARWESGRTVPTGTTLLAIQRALRDAHGAAYQSPRGTTMGTLERYTQMIDHLRGRPISASDREQLDSVKDDLRRIHERVNAIVAGYEPAVLIDPIDTDLLEGVLGPFAFTLSRGPTLRCLLGRADNGAEVFLDLDRSPHGIVITGPGFPGRALAETLVTSAARPLGANNKDLEVWLVHPPEFAPDHAVYENAPVTLEVGESAPRLAAAAATSLREQINHRERQILDASDTDTESFVQYWNWQKKNPDKPKMRLVLLQVNGYQTLCGDEEFERILLEVLRKGRTLGIHVQLCATEIPDGRHLSMGTHPHLGYRAILNSTEHTMSQLLPPAVAQDIGIVLDEPGVGIVFSPSNGLDNTRFRCTTLLF